MSHSRWDRRGGPAPRAGELLKPLLSAARALPPRRHVVLPPEIASHLPKNRLLEEVSGEASGGSRQ